MDKPIRKAVRCYLIQVDEKENILSVNYKLEER